MNVGIGHVVLHTVSGVIGTVTEVFPPGSYKPTINTEVVKLDTGDAFLNHSENGETRVFTILSEAESRFYLQACELIKMSQATFLQLARTLGIEPKKAVGLIRSTFEQAVRNLTRE